MASLPHTSQSYLTRTASHSIVIGSDEEQRDTVIARRTIVRRGNLIPDPQIATASMKPRNDRGKTIINISITYIWFHQPKMSESPTIYVHITLFCGSEFYSIFSETGHKKEKKLPENSIKKRKIINFFF